MLYQLSYLAISITSGPLRPLPLADHNNQPTPRAMRGAGVCEFRDERGGRIYRQSRVEGTLKGPSDVCDLANDGANQNDGKLERAKQRGADIQLLTEKHWQPPVNEAANCVPRRVPSARERPMPRLAQISIPRTRANTGAECSATERGLRKRGEGAGPTSSGGSRRTRPTSGCPVRSRTLRLVTVWLKPDTTYESLRSG